jgi:hypothetical protein
MPVVYRVGASDNPPNFTQLVRNIVYFVEVKTGYWLNNAIATAATEPQPLNANLSKISELSSVTAFGLGLLALEAAQQVRDKIGAVSLQQFEQTVNDLVSSKQPLSEQLSAIASLSSVTDFGVALLTLADAVSIRSSIGAASTEELQSYARLTGDGTIPTSMLPNDALVNIVTATSEAEMLALADVQPGDTVLRLDLPSQKLFTLLALPASDLRNWEQSGLGIQTLNGRSGPIVNLGAGDIGADPIGSADRVRSLLQLHESDNSNPHEVTPEQIGAELAGASGAVVQSLALHERNTDNPHQVTVGQIGGQPYSSRLDAVTAAGPGILKVQSDQSLIQVPSTSVGELILSTSTARLLELTPSSVIIPTTTTLPITLTANTQLEAPIAKILAPGKPVLDGQSITIINVSTFWLFVPTAGGIKAVPPRDNLTFTFSEHLSAWTAPATIKTLMCRVFNTVDQVIPAGANLMTPVMFDSTRSDTSNIATVNGIMRDKVNNNRLIAPVSGHYTFNGHFQISVTAGVIVAAFLRINGGIVAPTHITGNSPFFSFPGSYFMAAGSFADIALRVYSAVSSATIVRVGGFSPEFEMRLFSLT